MRPIALAIVLFTISTIPCIGGTITVDDDGPADFNSIQTAINDANTGDTIVVRLGLYYENIHMKNGVTVKGSGPDVTIIDGRQKGHVVIFNLASATIGGFTITNILSPSRPNCLQ